MSAWHLRAPGLFATAAVRGARFISKRHMDNTAATITRLSDKPVARTSAHNRLDEPRRIPNRLDEPRRIPDRLHEPRRVTGCANLGAKLRYLVILTAAVHGPDSLETALGQHNCDWLRHQSGNTRLSVEDVWPPSFPPDRFQQNMKHAPSVGLTECKPKGLTPLATIQWPAELPRHATNNTHPTENVSAREQARLCR